MKLTIEQLKELKSATPEDRPAMLYQLATVDQIERCLILLQEPLLQSLLLKGYKTISISSHHPTIELSESGRRYKAGVARLGFPDGGYLAIPSNQWLSIQELSLLRKYMADLFRNIRHRGLSSTAYGKNQDLSPTWPTPSCDQKLIHLAKSHHSQILAYKKHRNYENISTQEIVLDIDKCRSRTLILVAGSQARLTKLITELSSLASYKIFVAKDFADDNFMQKAILAHEEGDLSYHGVVIVLVESRTQLKILRSRMSLPELVLP